MSLIPPTGAHWGIYRQEFNAAYIDGSFCVPHIEVSDHLDKFPKDKEIILYCRSARRSAEAQQLLATLGYSNTYNMEGGILAWQAEQLPVIYPEADA